MSKQYTGHKSIKMMDGESIVDRIQPTLDQESQLFGVEKPSREQVALVVSALRMHPLLAHAAQYDFSEPGKPDEVTKYWPIESSIGRFFRDASREVLDECRLRKDGSNE